MRIRINQIECRFSQGRYEIVKWQPNCYYGKQQEYIDNGWILSGGMYRLNNTSISEGLFALPETCYTVATLHYDDDERCCSMKTVGARLLDSDILVLFKRYIPPERIQPLSMYSCCLP
jgi:hypothetical protein